jgi:hypothetical protein
MGSGGAVLLSQHQRWDRYHQHKRNKLPQNICFFLAELHCGLLTINAHIHIGEPSHWRTVTPANPHIGGTVAVEIREPEITNLTTIASLTGGGGPRRQTCIHASPGVKSLPAKRATRPSQPRGGFAPPAAFTRGAEERYQKFRGHAIVLLLLHAAPLFCCNSFCCNLVT